MPYRVQSTKPAQDPTQHWQKTHTTHLSGMGGRPTPMGIAGLDQPFPYAHDWRGRSGVGPFPGPRAPHARDPESYGQSSPW